MMLPPPNVTGTLHLGHALTIAIQDSLARWCVQDVLLRCCCTRAPSNTFARCMVPSITLAHVLRPVPAPFSL